MLTARHILHVRYVITTESIVSTKELKSVTGHQVIEAVVYNQVGCAANADTLSRVHIRDYIIADNATVGAGI
jgi:hypothetical protein